MSIRIIPKSGVAGVAGVIGATLGEKVVNSVGSLSERFLESLV